MENGSSDGSPMAPACFSLNFTWDLGVLGENFETAENWYKCVNYN